MDAPACIDRFAKRRGHGMSANNEWLAIADFTFPVLFVTTGTLRTVLLTLLIVFGFSSSSFSTGLHLITGRGRKLEVETEIDRGIIKFTAGDKVAARAHYDAAIKLDPKAWQAYYDRAVLSMIEKKWAPALSDLNESIRLNPKYLHAAVMRSEINAHLGNYDAALSELDHLSKIQLNQSAEDVYNNRAWIRATARNAAFRNGKLAVEDGIRACNVSRWKSPFSLDSLAAGYAELGDFDSAARYEQKAIENVNEIGAGPVSNNYFRKEFEQRLIAFKQHKLPSYN